jgi:hypothetical protein
VVGWQEEPGEVRRGHLFVKLGDSAGQDECRKHAEGARGENIDGNAYRKGGCNRDSI